MSINQGKKLWHGWDYITLVRKESQMGPKKKAVKKKPVKRRRKAVFWMARDRTTQGCYVLLHGADKPTIDKSNRWEGGCMAAFTPKLFHSLSSVRLRKGECVEIESSEFKVKKGK